MPTIEEVFDDDDIDNKDYDPAEFDASNPFSTSMPVESGVRLRPVQQSQEVSPAAPSMPASLADLIPPGGGLPSGLPADFPAGGASPLMQQQKEIPEHMQSWSIIYPCYFDAQRSVAEGRRVPKDQAVKSPLATNIADALKSLGIESALELTKTHPKDWANPGRVRVDPPKGSKRKLYAEISKYLQQHPASEETARVQLYRQLAQFDSLKPLAKPKGMKMGDILPGVSPALSASKELEKTMGAGMGNMFGF